MKEVQDHGRASGDFMDFDSGTEGKPVPVRLLHVRSGSEPGEQRSLPDKLT